MALHGLIRALARRIGRRPKRAPILPRPEIEGVLYLYDRPTDAGFDEAVYLAHNPDVAAAVAGGLMASGRDHFERFGHLGGHRVPVADGHVRLPARRAAKAERLRAIIKPGLPAEPGPDGVFDFLTPELAREFGVFATDKIAGADYDAETVAVIDRCRGGLVLDCGAGSRSVYFDHVVNYEIARYPSTDVLGVAEALPFADDSFDAVLSFAVLEHVKDPFKAAAEIARVLKPGGTLRVYVPFLQPLHGYPSHYYNMTHVGLRSLFEKSLAIESQFVAPAFGPVWALHMIVRAWHDGLPEAQREAFLAMPLRDFHGYPAGLMAKPFATELPEAVNFEIASGTGLTARKPMA